MTDAVSAARTARENLARGLSALQDPAVPLALGDVATSVAAAMSALHRIEASAGAALGEAGPAALNSVRQALNMLQTQPADNPAVTAAIEAVAGSLSVIHSLNQMIGVGTQPPAPIQAAAAPLQPPPAQAAPAAPGLGSTVALGAGVAAVAAGPATQPSPGQIPGAPGPAPWENQPTPWQAQPAPAAQPQQQPYAQPQPAAQPYAQPPAAQPYAQPPQPAAQPYVQPAAAPPQPIAQPAAQAPAPAVGDGVGKPAIRVEAELGAHSTTNFYKGLSGNDVIESGGIFVATYQIPDLGQDLMIKVSLPGGYEFEAKGVVAWTRDAPNSGADSPPGYGARFTEISPEGRQLVYRYVRNREPLFHDDL